MSAQQSYWSREADGDTEPPEPYRIYGTVRTADADARDYISEAWEIDEAEFDDWFGPMYLNATTSPSADAMFMWIIAAMASLVIAIVFAAGAKNSGYTAKCLRELERRGQLEEAAGELEDMSAQSYEGDKLRISRNYIFSRKTGAAVRCGDILWVYRKVGFAPRWQALSVLFGWINMEPVSVREYLYVYTSELKKLPIIEVTRESAYYGTMDALMARIRERSPSVLTGESKENEEAYRERRAAAINN